MSKLKDYRRAMDGLAFTEEQKESLARAAAGAAPEPAAPPARRPNFRVAVTAAALCLLLAVTAVAAWRVYAGLSLAHDGSRRYQYVLEGEVPPGAPETIREVRLPLEAAEELGLELRYTRRKADGSVVVDWRGTEVWQVNMSQYTFEGFAQTGFSHADADDKLTPETAELGGLPVTLLRDRYGSPDVLWSDGEYCYELHTSDTVSEEFLAALITGLAPVEDYEALAAEHPYYRPGSGELQTLLAPGSLPGGFDSFSWETGSLPHVFGWALDTGEGYGLGFQQAAYEVTTAYGSPVRYSYGTAHQYDLEIGGMTVEAHAGGNFRDYVWYNENDWCFLRFDGEVEDLLEGSFDDTAAAIIETLVRVGFDGLDAHMEGLGY